MRQWRKPHSCLTDEQRQRANARSYANVYRRRGKLIPKPCERCGDNDVVMHHADYSKPLKVTWLCRSCHNLVHCAMAAENRCVVGSDIGN